MSPDYHHWSAMARWSAEAAAALSLGLDPDLMSDEADHIRADQRETYTKRLGLIINHMQAGWLAHFSAPREFLAWAEANGIAVPEDLVAAARMQAGVIRDWRSELHAAHARIAELQSHRRDPDAEAGGSARERRLLPKEEASLLKLVLGMAMHKYGYNPIAAHTPTTQRIVSALAEAGFPLDAQTVLKWLRQAHDMVGGERIEGGTR